MAGLLEEVDSIAAESGFSGVVSVNRSAIVEFAKAYGWAHRGYRIANALDTRFAIAAAPRD